MSIVLKDGTVLPDLPEGLITEEYPYAVIGKAAEDGYYDVYSAKNEFAYIPKEVGNGVEVVGPFTDAHKGSFIEFGGTTWEEPWSDDGAPGFFLHEYEIVWSNHDILTATGLGEDYKPTLGTEIYFPSSVSKPPFILPDGTELPALPDGCFDGTPYGMIIGIDWAGNGQMMYSMQATSTPIVALPAELVPEDSGVQIGDGTTHLIMIQPCTGKEYMVDGEAWTASESGDISEPMVSLGIGVVLWANHDLNEVSTLNVDDMSYTIGTEIARKSDVNYRITDGWMKSIANEARRLGSVTGSMKPDVVENTLRATTTGGDFSEATLVNDGALLSNVKAYGKNGVLYTGTIPIRKPEDITTDGARTVVPWGYYANGLDRTGTTITQATPNISVNSNGVITATSTQSASGYMEAGTKSQTYTLSIADDSDFKANNIKSGVTIFGVTGSYEGEESLDDILYEEFIDANVNSDGQIELTTMHNIETLISFGFTLSCGQYDRQAYISASGNYSKDCTLHLIATDSDGGNMSHDTQRATVYKTDDVVRIDTDIVGLINANIMGSFVVYTTQN